MRHQLSIWWSAARVSAYSCRKILRLGSSSRSMHIKQNLLRALPIAAIAILVLASFVSAFAQPFTLEQVMGSPFPSELTAAKQGSRAAWLFDLRGERNIWVADGPEFVRTARQITQ